MQIDLTQQQYQRLLELVFLGNWVANATRDQGAERAEFDEMEHYILSLRDQFGLDDIATYDPELQEHFVTRAFEERMNTIIDEYDDDTFWSELAWRLAERDMMKKVTPVRQWPPEVERQLWKLADQYEQEFQKRGLERLVIAPPGKRTTE